MVVELSKTIAELRRVTEEVNRETVELERIRQEIEVGRQKLKDMRGRAAQRSGIITAGRASANQTKGAQPVVTL